MKLSRPVRSLSAIVTLGSCLLAGAQAGTRVSADALRAGCSDDAARLCAGVQPGGGRVIACLQQHKDALSNQCRQAAGLPPKPAPAPPAESAPSAAAPAASPGAPPPSTIIGATAPPSPALNKPTVVAGEKFVRRVIHDTTHENMIAASIRLPETWTLDSKVEWHYDWVENPISVSAHAVNPAGTEAFSLYPLWRLDAIEVAPQYRQYVKGRPSHPGDRMPTGAIDMPVQPPVQALATFIKQERPNATNLKWIGQQELPGLAKALGLNPWPNDHGVAIKVRYDLNGKPVEEAFFGVYYSSQGGNEAKSVGQMHMAANAIKQTNWGFRGLQSFRAPAGALDKRMAVFCLIAKSFAYSPEWQQLNHTIQEQMLAAFNQKLQQGYDQIRAGQAAMAQMQAQEKALNASVAKTEANLRSPGFDDSWLRTSSGGSGGGGAPRSSSDHFSDNIRGVDTMNDPSTGGTTQLSNAGQYHFTDGFGNYRTTDDPNYTPEKAGESGSWTQMTVAP
jgi:hypothetical protein